MSMTPEVVTVSPTAAASTTTINIATPAHIHVFVPRTSGSFNPHLVHIYFTFVIITSCIIMFTLGIYDPKGIQKLHDIIIIIIIIIIMQKQRLRRLLIRRSLS